MDDDDDDDDDDADDLLSDNSAESKSLTSDNSIAFEEFFGSDEFIDNFADTIESPAESEYSSFTISQQCVTSLMYLLDAMECPDYGFQAIMEWACQCFVSGFDFNPKCKTRMANLKWMYDSLHNAEQMLPHLELINLPDPLPNMKTMNVICYDFVPQLLSILQTQNLCWSTTWCLIRTTLWQGTSHMMAG